MIGLTLTEGKAKYRVVGQHGGLYVIARLDAHQAPFTASAAELGKRFKVESKPTPEASPEEGWRVLAAADAEAQSARTRPVDEPTPEDVFASVTAEPKLKGKRS